jgi:hypothetical protein
VATRFTASCLHSSLRIDRDLTAVRSGHLLSPHLIPR